MSGTVPLSAKFSRTRYEPRVINQTFRQCLLTREASKKKKKKRMAIEFSGCFTIQGSLDEVYNGTLRGERGGHLIGGPSRMRTQPRRAETKEGTRDGLRR